MLISLLHLLNKGQLSKFTGRQFQSTLLAWTTSVPLKQMRILTSAPW